MTKNKRLLIVGGVAGGASCAARARRLSEDVEIIIFEKGPFVSFANCGLPYHVGDVIPEEKDLLVATPGLFKKRFEIGVRVEHEVLSIDKDKKEIGVKDLKSGKKYKEKYDSLLLSPGASPIRPPLPGIDLPGIFTLRTIPDSKKIRERISERNATRAVIVGGGFIGLEMAENLVKRGLFVTIIEMLPQVMPSLDPEMASPVHDNITSHGVSLCLSDAVSGFEENSDGTISVNTKSGKSFITDVVILAIGVRPEIKIAKEAGLKIGELGGIRVNDQMRTSDKSIWAVGDAVEVWDIVLEKWTLLPLAGPANRQGRIAAGVILGRDFKFRGVQATAVCHICDLTIASTGTNEKNLNLFGIRGKPANYEKIYLRPGHHVGYYPGAKPIYLKLIFSKEDGKILGAQAVGEKGVEKRIDVISMAIEQNSTVFDLEEAELCYAPQFGAAKDPINLAGMIAANALRGDAPIAHWENIFKSDVTILDVRNPGEFEAGHVKGAVNIPLTDLRRRMDELSHDREIWTYCAVGQRSYYATRLLRLNGFDAKNLCGGFLTYKDVEGI